jgi:hypothetical protein
MQKSPLVYEIPPSSLNLSAREDLEAPLIMSVSFPSKLSAWHLIAILVKIRAGEVMLCVTSPVANTFPGRLYAFKGLAGINLFTQVAIVLELALIPSQGSEARSSQFLHRLVIEPRPSKYRDKGSLN